MVLIGGIAFYFHRKTNALQEDIEVLKKQYKELAQAFQELQENQQQLGSMVVQLQQVVGRRPAPPSPKQRPPVVPLNNMGGMVQQMIPGLSPMHHDSRPARKKKHRREKSDSEDSGDETFDDQELDKELAGEYQQLSNERKKNMCEGDVCSLK